MTAMAALRLSQFCTEYDDDLRPQLVSWAIAIAAGAAWLALVYLTPAAVVPAGPAVVSEPDDVVALWDGGAAKATRRVEDHGRLVPKPSIATLQKAELTVAGAFATTLAAQVTDNVAAVIRGVQAVQGRASGNDASGKTALSAGTHAACRPAPTVVRWPYEIRPRGRWLATLLPRLSRRPSTAG